MQPETLVKEATSTPLHKRDGQAITIPLAKLGTYEINIRSFHPSKDFGWGGFWFEGDARGFSLRRSGKGKADSQVTSRIWHRYKLDTSSGDILNTETESNDSRASLDDEPTKYEGDLKPRGVILPVMKKSGTQIVTLGIEGKYGGENHAFLWSKFFKRIIGDTFVPTLNVNYRFTITIDRIMKHMDIVTYITGDGFPNCEAFITDQKGVAIFLGVHVRKGAAFSSLPFDKNMPMIASAIRLSIDDDGNFSGMMGNELKRRKQGKEKLEYHPISEWNKFFLDLDPSTSRNTDFYLDPSVK